MEKKSQDGFFLRFFYSPFLKEWFRLRPLLWSTSTLNKLISFRPPGGLPSSSTSSPVFTTPHPRFYLLAILSIVQLFLILSPCA